MLNLDVKKENEIKKFVGVLKQMELSDIILLSRDANTLLMRQQVEEEKKEGVERWENK